MYSTMTGNAVSSAADINSPHGCTSATRSCPRPTGNVKLSVLLDEMFRHCKAIGAWGDGETVLVDAGVDVKAPGVLLEHDSFIRNAQLGVHGYQADGLVVDATLIRQNNAEHNKPPRSCGEVC